MAAIRIEIYPLGFIHVALVQPRSPAKAERLLILYRALRPEIEALERAARVEGPRVAWPTDGGDL